MYCWGGAVKTMCEGVMVTLLPAGGRLYLFKDTQKGSLNFGKKTLSNEAKLHLLFWCQMFLQTYQLDKKN